MDVNDPTFQPKLNASRSEQLVDRALQSARVPSDWLRDMRPAAGPQQLFPSKEGRSMAWTVEEVLSIGRRVIGYRSWTSGMAAPRSTMNGTDAGAEGTSRYSMNMQEPFF